MNTVKLSEPGEEVIFAPVAHAERRKGQFGNDLCLNDGTTEVYVPEKAADRQLDRLGLTDETIVGQSIRVSRSMETGSNNKPFWNIDLMGPMVTGKPAPKAAPRAAPAPHAASTGVADPLALVVAAHLRCVKYVLDMVVPLAEAKGVTIDGPAFSALTAQVFIAAKDFGYAKIAESSKGQAKPAPAPPKGRRPSAAPSSDDFPPPQEPDELDDEYGF